jgi:hypothetical protein
VIRKSFEPSPMPNQIRAGESSEIDGTNRPNWMYGSRNRRAKGRKPISSPVPAPRVHPRVNPAKIRPRLTRMSEGRRPATISLANALTTSTGVGKRIGGKNAALTTCQTSVSRQTEAMGMSAGWTPRVQRRHRAGAGTAVLPTSATLASLIAPPLLAAGPPPRRRR